MKFVFVLTLIGAGVAMMRFLVLLPTSAGESSESVVTVDSPAASRVSVHPVTINAPDGPPRLNLAAKDEQGRPMSIACSTCHTIKASDPTNATKADLDEFHQGLTIAHGGLSCLSCHNADDYDTLRLADGRSVPYPEVMTMCAQCHGPQMRDYRHGAHGGMSGYWDLSRGPRVRNNCIDCHDPHAPAFPEMYPTFKPIDRFLTPTGPEVEEIHGDELEG
ncbi:MAG: hypothetical protein ACF8PN_15610 [Phycisphaerales bacterium]